MFLDAPRTVTRDARKTSMRFMENVRCIKFFFWHATASTVECQQPGNACYNIDYMLLQIRS